MSFARHHRSTIALAVATFGVCIGVLSVGCSKPKDDDRRPRASNVAPLANTSLDRSATAQEPVEEVPVATDVRAATAATSNPSSSPDDPADDDLLADEWEPEAFLEPRTTDDDSPFGTCGGCGCWSP